MLSTPTFFVADRLRGIPLVSNGFIRENKRLAQQQRQNQSLIIYDEPDREDSISSNKEIDQRFTTQKSIQVGKRDASIETMAQHNSNSNNNNQDFNSQITGTVGLLFKPSAITATAANIVRNTKPTTPRTTSTTTRRPSSKRPKSYARYETVKPKPKSTPKPTAKSTPKHIQKPTTTTSSTTTATTSTPTTTSTELSSVITTTTTTTAAPTTKIPTTTTSTTTTTTSTPITTTTKSPSTTATAKMSSKAPLQELSKKTTTISRNHLLSTKSLKFEKVLLENGKPITTNVPNLTRVTQATQTTQPGFQRRTPQAVLSSKFTNRPNDGRNGFAGENWVLFNRQDGQFSLFEVLTLMSCIMIVSTIFLVILFNWVKCFQKKRKSTSHQKQLDVLENGLNKNSSVPESTAANGNNDRISKLSMLSESMGSPSVSGTQKSPSVVSTVATSLSSDLKKKVEAEVSNQAKTLTTNAMDYAAKNVQNGTQMVGSALNISSDFKGVSNMANKAMAIVQPTENNDTHSSAYTEVADKLVSNIEDDAAKLGKMAQNELLQQLQQRTISRSVSDLSGKQKQMVAESMGVESERVIALEEIFNGSAPNLTNIKNEVDKDKTLKMPQKGNPSTNVASDVAHSSVSSLESIELPETLVESIKQTDSKNATGKAVEQPSPNLLLGQATATSAAEVPANSSGDTQKEQAKQPDLKNGKAVSKSGVSTNIGVSKKTKQSNESKSPSSKITPQKGGRQEEAQNERPANPMGRESGTQNKSAGSNNNNSSKQPAKKLEKGDSRQNVHNSQADVKNHQVVVNKLDKRKTNLEIVDLRDASVAGNLVNNKKTSNSKKEDEKKTEDSSSGWISMDGVAVVGNQTASGSLIGTNSSGAALGQAPNLAQSIAAGAAANNNGQQEAVINQQQQQVIMSPSDIIESRFNVDYRANKKNRIVGQQTISTTTTTTNDGTNSKNIKNMESIDSNQEEYILNNIENELEQDNKMRNRKYFVYIVHDGHFTAKKECIARIELPQKRRITLAEVRQLISNSQDISLSSLRRSKFKFVTETYRLLNENEDAAVLHQVYPTQGVFLKLNIPEQENPVYPFKGHTSRLSSSGSNPMVSSSLSQTTIASRRRANVRNNMPSAKDNNLPAIEVDYASGGGGGGGSSSSGGGAMSYGRMRTSSVGRRTATGGGAASRDGGRQQQPLSNYRRSKSSVQVGRQRGGQQQAGTAGRKQSNLGGDKLPAIGRYPTNTRETTIERSRNGKVFLSSSSSSQQLSSQTTSSKPLSSSPLPTLSNAATDLGNKVISGAKGLFNATFNR